jgi:hypothetical protein
MVAAFSCNTRKSDNCLMTYHKEPTVICMNKDCDTVNGYYLNMCTKAILYEKDSAIIIIRGNYTKKKL